MSTDCTRLQPPSLLPLEMKTMLKMLWWIRINLFELLPCSLKEVKCRAMKCLAREDGNYLRRPNYPNYLTAVALESLLHFQALMSEVSFYTWLCQSLSLPWWPMIYSWPDTVREVLSPYIQSRPKDTMCSFLCLHIFLFSGAQQLRINNGVKFVW